jgi:hypothetical protein
MWPFSEGQIQTSSQAGGMASACSRSRLLPVLIVVPSGSWKLKSCPRRRRVMPGCAPLTWRRPLARAICSGSSSGAIEAIGMEFVLVAICLRIDPTVLTDSADSP